MNNYWAYTVPETHNSEKIYKMYTYIGLIHFLKTTIVGKCKKGINIELIHFLIVLKLVENTRPLLRVLTQSNS